MRKTILFTDDTNVIMSERSNQQKCIRYNDQ